MSIYITRQMIDPASNARGREASNGFLGRLVRAAIRNWQRRKMIATLEALDDNVLSDIGVNRGEIRRVVDGFSDCELGMRPLASTDEQYTGPEREYLQAA